MCCLWLPCLATNPVPAGSAGPFAVEERAHSSSDGDNMRGSQSFTKQWVHLRKQVADLRQALASKEEEVHELQRRQRQPGAAPIACIHSSVVSTARLPQGFVQRRCSAPPQDT